MSSPVSSTLNLHSSLQSIQNLLIWFLLVVDTYIYANLQKLIYQSIHLKKIQTFEVTLPHKLKINHESNLHDFVLFVNPIQHSLVLMMNAHKLRLNNIDIIHLQQQNHLKKPFSNLNYRPEKFTSSPVFSTLNLQSSVKAFRICLKCFFQQLTHISTRKQKKMNAPILSSKEDIDLGRNPTPIN